VLKDPTEALIAQRLAYEFLGRIFREPLTSDVRWLYRDPFARFASLAAP